MSTENEQKKSQLIGALREGVAIVQMVFFKEMKNLIDTKKQELDAKSRSMLAGAVTNELFGTPNPEPLFQQFRERHRADIEQILLGLADDLPMLQSYITDALRVQTLCDSQEGKEDATVLAAADKCGILIKDRDVPLPSVFMTLARGLGQKYQLIIPPGTDQQRGRHPDPLIPDSAFYRKLGGNKPPDGIADKNPVGIEHFFF